MRSVLHCDVALLAEISQTCGRFAIGDGMVIWVCIIDGGEALLVLNFCG